jgi:hypothetical protein
MYTFLVLGIIPGTTIQISFDLWLQIVLEFIGCAVLGWLALSAYEFFAISDSRRLSRRLRLSTIQLRQRAQ